MPSALAEKIRSRGYWEVKVRPTVFAAERIKTLGELERGVNTAHVELRGWDYPHQTYRGHKPPQELVVRCSGSGRPCLGTLWTRSGRSTSRPRTAGDGTTMNSGTIFGSRGSSDAGPESSRRVFAG